MTGKIGNVQTQPKQKAEPIKPIYQEGLQIKLIYVTQFIRALLLLQSIRYSTSGRLQKSYFRHGYSYDYPTWLHKNGGNSSKKGNIHTI